MNRCRDCKFWGEHKPRPWTGSMFGPSPRRAAEQLDERDCLRIGGFSNTGSFRPDERSPQVPRFIDGDHMPRDEAYLVDHVSLARLVTCPEFGCALWETK